MGIVKELSAAARAPGSPAILGKAGKEIIRQGERIEFLEAQLAAADELAESTRPFTACVFNDNGDVTVSQGNLKRGDWLRIDRTATAYRKARGGET